MTVTVVAIEPHTAAILAVLQATSVLFDRGERPVGACWQGAEGTSKFKPYGILHTVDATFEGPVSDSEADLVGVWQVTAVGATQAQAEKVADVARTALRTAVISVAGRTITRVRCEPAGSRPDRTVTPQLWNVTDRYRITSTPA